MNLNVSYSDDDSLSKGHVVLTHNYFLSFLLIAALTLWYFREKDGIFKISRYPSSSPGHFLLFHLGDKISK